MTNSRLSSYLNPIAFCCAYISSEVSTHRPHVSVIHAKASIAHEEVALPSDLFSEQL
jgi:hypothetical protein